MSATYIRLYMCVYIYIYIYIYSRALVHERPCSRTIRFTNKFSEQKTSRMTNGFSDYEYASWQQRQAESISGGVSCWLTLAQYTSLLDFGLRTFRFTNDFQERIKFVNRGPHCIYMYPATAEVRHTSVLQPPNQMLTEMLTSTAKRSGRSGHHSSPSTVKFTTERACSSSVS
jgi:hypothetical protein